MLLVKLTLVNTIHPQGKTFVVGVEIKATGDSKLNDSPDLVESRNTHYCAMETSDKGHTGHLTTGFEYVL